MRRTICCAFFGLLISTGAVFPQWHAASRGWGRPRVRVIGVRRFAAPPALFSRCYLSVPFPYPVLDPVPYPVWNFIAPWPTYVFLGGASATHPQLVFKDGTTYTVTDYWRVNDELHFITLEESGTKSVPHTVPFGDLDVQRTTEVNSAEGFRFMVRDEPIEQWLQHQSQKHAPRRHRNNGVS